MCIRDSFNKGDRVLNRSYDKRAPGIEPLGLEPGAVLAPSAVYVDLSGLSGNVGDINERHENFGKKGMYDQVYVCEFFQQALTSQAVILNNSNTLTVVPNKRYEIKFKRNGKDLCFGS